MTIAELRELPIWGLLPAAIKKTLEEAESLGWELHGKGATIAFRLDRAQDELDLPVYAQWEIGKTPKGAVSFKSGKGGVPHSTLSISDLSEYLNDPSVVYPLEDEPRDTPKLDKTLEDSPPWDESATPEQNLSASLGATEVVDMGTSHTTPKGPPLRVAQAKVASDKPPRPLGVSPLRV